MTEVQAIIVGAIIGGGIAFAAAFFSYRWNRSVSLESIRAAEFNRAAAEFKNAFLPQVLYLKHSVVHPDFTGRSDDINSFLSFAAHRNLEAIESFKSRLCNTERIGLDRAWHEYCHPDGVPKDKYEKRDFIFDGYYHLEESSGEEAAKRIALEKINNILKFAAFK